MHQVYLAGRDARFTVDEGETVLAAGLRQRFMLPFGCQSGGCGSCRVRLLQGEVEHRMPPPALSAAEIEAGYMLMCLAQPKSDLTIDLHQPPQLENLRPRQLPCRALSREMLADDVIRFVVKLPKGERFDYLPGQYIDFLLEDGRRRSFSLANAPNGETLEMHLRITPGGRFARWVQREMPDRAILRFEGPLGAFYIREKPERPIVMVAGGTGFAPLKAMLEGLFAAGLKRPVHLFWGARRRADLYLHALVEQWARQHPLFRYTPVLSEPDADWRGETGLVHEAVLRAHPQLGGHAAYLSGPPAMVRAGKDAFIAAGLDADHLYYDSFDYAFETWPASN
jgi:CDP-4-dehydro-6-deoxyglucose reductase